MTKVLILLVPLIIAIGFNFIGKAHEESPQSVVPPKVEVKTSPSTTPQPIPLRKIISNEYHVFQTFNNCGPAALSMALSYYNIDKSQQELGLELRPLQNSRGDNDDKSVTLSELALKAQEYNLVSFHRPNGSIELIKSFITNDIPVITRTLLEENEDIGHYRVIKGYDDTTNELIQDDSLQGKNLRYSYEEFNKIWKRFSYEYLVLVPFEKQNKANQILGEEVDSIISWQKAVERSRENLAINPNDIYERFNLSVALYNIENYQESVNEFEQIKNSLSFRTLWYQIEPIHAYYKVGNYDEVLSLTNKIINNHNRAFSELYILRGNVYKAQGNLEMARTEYEKAIFYNKNLKIAQEALSNL